MVLPLLGLLGLGVGLAAKPYYDRWSEGIEARGRAKRMEEGMGGLLDDPEATQLDIGKGLLRSGAIDAGDFLSSAFGQENEFLSQMFDTARGRASAEADQAKLLEGRMFDLDAEFQPRFDALSGRMAGYERLGGLMDGAIELAGEEGSTALTGVPFTKSLFRTEEGRMLWNQLLEEEERDFFRYKNEVYGEAEAPPAVLKQLRQSYLQATGGGVGAYLAGEGQLGRAREALTRRTERVGWEAKELQREYERNQDRVRTGFADRFDMGGVQARGSDLGGRADAATRSDRNLIQRESGGNWGATNSEGMLGRAQFSPARLEEAGAAGALPPGVTREEFLSSPEIQRGVEDWHWRDIEDFMEANELDALEGSQVLGIPVTWQGMLNVAHLGGKNGLARFLATRGRYNPADSNGTRLSDYLAMGARGG